MGSSGDRSLYECAMLSIGIVGPDQPDSGVGRPLRRRASVRYYIEAVANSIDDYYVGSGEAPGYWIGAGALSLGLVGQVEEASYLAVMEALDPTSGESLLVQRQDARVRGYDLTFSAPKGLSLLWAFADGPTRERISAIHDTAVSEALAVMEAEACRVRRGVHGERTLDGAGFVGAAFRHRQSREGDPQLHTHVVVANMAAGPDDRWTSLHGAHLFDFAAAVGACYQSALRRGSAELGLSWEVRANGLGEVEGIPRTVLRAFSKRRRGIEADMAARGVSSANEARRASTRTRRAKDPALALQPDDGLTRRWREELAGLSLGGREAGIGDVTGSMGRARRIDELGADLVAELVEPGWNDIPGAEAEVPTRRRPLWRRASTLTYAQVIRGLATAADASPAQVIRAARAVFGRGDVVPVAATAPVRAGRRRFTAAWVLEEEAALLARVAARLPVPPCAPGLLATAVATAGLGRDQERAVRAVLGSTRAVDVVVGQAGSGKTHLLSVLRRAWEAEGRVVVGTALAAVAAKRLEEGSGIRSETAAQVLRDIEAPGALGPGAVLVVDEAGVIGTHMLGRLLGAAERSGARVVLIGDHHQLPEVDTGGAFRALARDPTATLNVNRRQERRWERHALAQLRHGAVGAALEAYKASGRLHISAHLEDAMDELVAGWGGAPGSLMVAATRAEVEGLNRRARELLASRGALAGPEVDFGERSFRVGEAVVALRVDRRIGLRNGERGVVIGLDELGVVARMEDGRTQAIPASYAAEHLDWGYALTAHKSQGITVGSTHVLGTEALYRELGYTGMSRGRVENHLYVVLGEDDVAETLTQRLERSAGQHLATESLPALPVPSQFLLDDLEEMDSLTRRTWLSPAEETRLAGLGRTVPRDLSHLGEEVALARPVWATTVLGETPLSSATAREVWTTAAGRLAAHRHRTGIAIDDPRPFGPSMPGASDAGLELSEELRRARLGLGLDSEIALERRGMERAEVL